MERVPGRPFTRAAIATAAYGVLHSILASRGAKERAARWLGRRHRDGLYRGFFNAQAVLSFVALAVYLRSLPRRELYRVEGPGAALMRTVQLAAGVWGFLAARSVGLAPLTGWASFRDWLRGASPFPEPEAQGPAPAADGGLRVEGPFRLSRHPLNFAPLPIFWMQPVMTTRWLGFTAVSTVYLVLGSFHEERRLEAAYGEPYRRYRSGPTPFYLPRPGPARIPRDEH